MAGAETRWRLELIAERAAVQRRRASTDLSFLRDDPAWDAPELEPDWQEGDDEPVPETAPAVEVPQRAVPRARGRKRTWRPRENRRVQLRRLGLTPGTYRPGRVQGHLTRKERRTLAEWPRPRTWGECKANRWWGNAPCPYVSCRGNLGIDVSAAGSIRVVLGLGDGRGSCSLELGEDGTRTLEEVAELEGCTREAVRLIEASALLKIRRLVDE